jgi:exopolysaccharide biosynthesis polyprenyl glycosylphosphotransferase
MTHDASLAGVALQEPPPDRRGYRHRTGPTLDYPSRPEPPPPAAGLSRPSPVELLPWLDASALLLVLVPLGNTTATALLAAAAAILVYAAAGLYRSRLTHSVLDDLPTLLGGSAAGVLAGTAFGTLATSASGLGHLVGLTAAATGATMVGHLVAYPLERRSRRRAPSCPTLIVGTAAVGTELGNTLRANPHYGMHPVGYLDEVPAGRRPLPAPLLGTGRDLVPTLEALGVRCVLVAYGSTRPADLVELLRVCDRYHCRIFFVPRFYELHQANRDTDSIGNIPLVRLHPDARHRKTWWLKRAMDVAVATAALVLSAPVLAVCALAIRLESGAGVLFRQERVGMDGRRFVILKLRTLRPSSEFESRTQWSVADDPRLGRVGRLLRAASLDELPQLVNVLRGEMSLVGPRPERPFFVEDFSRSYPGYAARHRVPVGLTGWAAVNGLRGDTSIGSRACFDNSYIENWSLWLDIKILIRTIGAVLVRSGG